MPRKLSTIAPDWWDYTTLEDDLIRDAAALLPSDLQQLSRPGFRVVMYDTLEDFYLAEALEYIGAWRQATADNPVGICGPIGPTEQLPLVARLVNERGQALRHAPIWGMDERIGDAGRADQIAFGAVGGAVAQHPPLAAVLGCARSPVSYTHLTLPTSYSG